jgi:hypothetical protein
MYACSNNSQWIKDLEITEQEQKDFNMIGDDQELIKNVLEKHKWYYNYLKQNIETLKTFSLDEKKKLIQNLKNLSKVKYDDLTEEYLDLIDHLAVYILNKETTNNSERTNKFIIMNKIKVTISALTQLNKYGILSVIKKHDENIKGDNTVDIIEFWWYAVRLGYLISDICDSKNYYFKIESAVNFFEIILNEIVIDPKNVNKKLQQKITELELQIQNLNIKITELKQQSKTQKLQIQQLNNFLYILIGYAMLISYLYYHSNKKGISKDFRKPGLSSIF